MRDGCWPSLDWQLLLVHAKAKHPEELELIANEGIKLVQFSEVLHELRNSEATYKAQSGTDIVDIITYFNTLTALHSANDREATKLLAPQRPS